MICPPIMRAMASGSLSAAEWGVTVTRGCAHKALVCGRGSVSNTSSVAPLRTPLFKRIENVGFDLQLAAPRIDQRWKRIGQRAVLRKPAKQARIQNPGGFSGVRQQADKDIGLSKKAG
jgi:hypothetical protein